MRAHTQQYLPPLPPAKFTYRKFPTTIRTGITIRKPRNAAEIECRLIQHLIRETTPEYARDSVSWTWSGRLLHREKNDIARYMESLKTHSMIAPGCRFYMYSHADLYISVFLHAHEGSNCSVTVCDYGTAPGALAQTHLPAVPKAGFEHMIGGAA